MSSDYVFTMYRADKFYGPERQVLANISLSFLPGAKIGVLGPNDRGRSILSSFFSYFLHSNRALSS